MSHSSSPPSKYWWLVGVAVPIAVAMIGRIKFEKPRETKAAKLCADKSNWPRGVWYVRWVKVEGEHQDTSFNGELMVDDNAGGKWFGGDGRQLANGQYERGGVREAFTVTPPIEAGKKVVLTYQQSKVPSKNTLTVTGDGCSMEGMFDNPQANVTGFVIYCWNEAGQHCLSPPEGTGWRKPVLGDQPH
jgi:hypothetical protein